MEVVRRIKRGTGIRRIGHAGTLDPIATGVIPVCLGQATRLMEYLVSGSKEYRATIELGIETDTYDSLGKILETKPVKKLNLSTLKQSLALFKGPVEQTPPMYSALKQRGKRLYNLARSGIHVDRPARLVDVFRLDLVDWVPPFITIEVTSGPGFYVRSLAHDMGKILGCGGHLKELIRLRSGRFRLQNAVSLDDLEVMIKQDTWEDQVFSLDVAVLDLISVIVNKKTEMMIKNGRNFPVNPRRPLSPNENICRAYNVNGKFIGILELDSQSSQWHPKKVFHSETDQ